MEPILRSVLSFDLECVLLQMAATLVKQSVAVLNFHVDVIN